MHFSLRFAPRLFRMHKNHRLFGELHGKKRSPARVFSFTEAATNFADGRPFDLISAK
jgi:hypothetical protein